MGIPSVAIVLLAAAVHAPDSTSVEAVKVCGIDVSGSVRSVSRLQRLCARVVASARPGDVVIVRLISDSSFRSEEELVAVRLPSVTDQCRNPYDSGCRRQAIAMQRRFVTVRDSAVQIVLSATPRAAARTDLGGFLAAASTHFAELSDFRRRLIFLTGDLLHTGGKVPSIQLAGADVVLLAIEQGGDFQRGIANRRMWERRFRAAGATVRSCTLIEEVCIQ